MNEYTSKGDTGGYYDNNKYLTSSGEILQQCDGYMIVQEITKTDNEYLQWGISMDLRRINKSIIAINDEAGNFVVKKENK